MWGWRGGVQGDIEGGGGMLVHAQQPIGGDLKSWLYLAVSSSPGSPQDMMGGGKECPQPADFDQHRMPACL